jgi:hypothetical protein
MLVLVGGKATRMPWNSLLHWQVQAHLYCISFSLSSSSDMSFAGYDESAAWGAGAEESSGDIVKDAIRKEAVIKYVPTCHSSGVNS